jgi:DNA-binding NarL/FixJ family response regulator
VLSVLSVVKTSQIAPRLHPALESCQPAPVKRVLVIEDQAPMRRNLLTLLEMEGFQPLGADNGREGIEIARREKPDLILCDVMMPEVDGHAVLNAVRADPDISQTPFIFLSARGEKLDVRLGMNLGADDYLTKPAGTEELLAAIEARLERHESMLAHNKARAAGFRPDFSQSTPLETLGLTPREAEVLLWVAQGKSNGDIAIILEMAEKTVKKHLTTVFEKLGVDGRHAATLRALELLSSPLPPPSGN